jgi:hypothetical protein
MVLGVILILVGVWLATYQPCAPAHSTLGNTTVCLSPAPGQGTPEVVSGVAVLALGIVLLLLRDPTYGK